MRLDKIAKKVDICKLSHNFRIYRKEYTFFDIKILRPSEKCKSLPRPFFIAYRSVHFCQKFLNIYFVTF
jgi:hypothetical protein